MTAAREERIKQALFRGENLVLGHSGYLSVVRQLTRILLRSDIASGDLTSEALKIGDAQASAVITACERGVVAGIEELQWVLEDAGISVKLERTSGEEIDTGEIVLRAEGERRKLIALERAGLNLLQRMSGIASLTRCVREQLRERWPSTAVVATRKTLWGLLDKRAVHVGGGGTHRIGLGDAILIKNNHLRLLGSREEDAVAAAIERAWRFRKEAAFIEVEVQSEAAALVAAETFRRVQEEALEQYPCLLMLDNCMPKEIGSILGELRIRNLWNYILTEASGGISEQNVEAYADTGVDAISIGALTHSARSLDLCQRIL